MFKYVILGCLLSFVIVPFCCVSLIFVCVEPVLFAFMLAYVIYARFVVFVVMLVCYVFIM